MISAVDMPGMSGIEFTQALRDSPRLKDIPVILVSSQDSADDRRKGADTGASAYLVKNTFDQSTILETVAELL